MRTRPVSLALALLVALIGSPCRSMRAQQVDVVRGHIVGPDSAAVEGATITVTSLVAGVSRTARTDRNGRFTVTVPGGEGDYMVAIAALGFAAKRFEVKRVADEDVLVADARLQRVAVALDAVRVSADRPKVSRTDVQQPDVGGSERPVDNAALPAAGLGDLAAMAASLPGVQLVPGENGGANGFSVLGLGADQNVTTLNGLAFGGGNLPRDAVVLSSLVTSPYDVARGGFSGAQFSLRTSPGSNFVSRGVSLNLDSPSAQWTDRAGQSLGQRYSNLSLGGTASGPLSVDQAFYNFSYQLGRRSNGLQTLLNTDPLGLQTSGVALDSVTRLLGILRQTRVPALVGGLPSDRNTDQGLVFGSVDVAPPSLSSGQAFNVTYNAGWSRQNPAFASVTEVPAHSGMRTSWNGGLQARHSGYLLGLLSETTLGATLARSQGTPYLEMPAGLVRVNSELTGGASAVQMLAFGGSQSLSGRQTTTSVGLLHQLSWFSTNNKHRLKLTSELRRDGYAQDQTTNLLGTFTFNSLADLEAARPASFTRQLSPRRSSGRELVAALSLGDSYRPTRDVQIQYGVRLDGNRFVDVPALNADVRRTFGVANDHVPNRLYVSPRVGFSWTYGTAAQIGAFDGAFRGPRGVVRGGIGLFQGVPSVSQLAGAIANTGLSSAVQQLTCVGAATPIPDWGAYVSAPQSIPAHCADGSTGSVFASAAPNVVLYDPGFAAPRSVRSNLQWTGPVLDNRVVLALEGTYSLNLDQPSMVDLNFAPTPRFTLADEESRPVFAQPTSIVPVTGVISTREARISPLFSRVSVLRSDLRSESRQLRMSVAPSTVGTTLSWSVSYVHSTVREQFRGFTSTAGNPLDVQWGRSPFDARHQFVYTVTYNLLDAVRVSWFGQVRSGSPFTPMVASDVNGDGYANDRAFVFDPSAAVGAGGGRPMDPALAEGMRTLLATGSREARDCLQGQLGRLAARDSCEGPWSASATLSIVFNPAKVRMPRRATVSLQLSNPLGAADLALHGSSGLRGWGQAVFPDPSLLYVRGFDPQTQRYRYEVNQRFGATSPAFNALRAPVTLTAMVRFDVGPTRERQQLTRQLDRGRTTAGTRLPEELLKAVYGTGGIQNPMATILRQQDTLRLTALQADSLASLNRWYTVRLDSIWSPVVRYLAGLPDRYDQGEAYARYLDARRASVDRLASIVPHVAGLLTAEQRRKLPALVASYLDRRYLASIRSGTSSFAGAYVPAGGAGHDGPERIGGERTVIIRH